MQLNTALSDFEQMCRNCNILNTDEMKDLFVRTFNACCQLVAEGSNLGLVEPLPESLELVDNLTDKLLSFDSQLINPENFKVALDFMASGGNVLMIQNHTSGADTFVWRTLVNRLFPNKPADEFAYMAGHVVNIYPVPLLFSSAFRRIQIFSDRYKQIAGQLGISEKEMTDQNCRALRSLMIFAKSGGKLVGLYPEGGRGEGELKFGDPNTAIIPQALGRFGNFLILPTYVERATSILPVRRTEQEFNEFLKYLRPGTADIICGQPYYWQDVDQTDKHSIHASIMRSIAALASTEEARGPWKQNN